ncbi:MAG: 2Fe-2S iron-sulfur cluster-binding protein [Myxococcota bacterium]|jgi:ferredoxin|nr:2Fe-2S iron-sulfur cluster-binding protein [Myxococcota bacterium]
MAQVRFLPANVEVEVGPGENLFQAATAAGVPIATVCGGLGACAGCRIRIVAGEENLTPITFREKDRLGNTYFITKERLACQTQVTGPAVVEVLQTEIRDKRERSRKRALDRTLENSQRRAERQASQEAQRAERAEHRRSGERQPPGASPGAGELPADPAVSPRRRRSRPPMTEQRLATGEERAAPAADATGASAPGGPQEHRHPARTAGPERSAQGSLFPAEVLPTPGPDGLPPEAPSSSSRRRRRRRGGRGGGGGGGGGEGRPGV